MLPRCAFEGEYDQRRVSFRRRFAGTNAVNISVHWTRPYCWPVRGVNRGHRLLSRGGRIYTKLAELASTENNQAGAGSEPFTGSGYISAPEHQSGG